MISKGLAPRFGSFLGDGVPVISEECILIRIFDRQV